MLTLRARFVDGKVTFVDDVPFEGQYEVLVTFLESDNQAIVFPEGQQDLVLTGLKAQLGLKSRELEVLKLIYQGMTNHEIAVVLALGDGTIRNYTSSLYQKLNVRNRTEAVSRAIELGLL